MKKVILWGLTASPYQLKMQSLLDFAGHDWVRWPEQAGRLSALSMAVRLETAKRRRTVLRYPTMSSQFDEYPAVPFYSRDGKRIYYDSSSLARHLDQHPGCTGAWFTAHRHIRETSFIPCPGIPPPGNAH